MNLVVFGVFWFRSQTSTDSQEQSPKFANEMTDDEPEVERKSAPDAELVSETTGVESEGKESPEMRRELLKEYWTLLIGTERRNWCPSKRVDIFREYGNILDYSFVEAKENLDVVMGLEDVSYYSRRDLANGLAHRMATLDPRAAIDFILESGHSFEHETCQSVARIWMDAEGLAVLDWFESSGMKDSESRLTSAFLAVYAEEDPYDYLLRYGTHSQGYYNSQATMLLYDEYGSAVYEDLKHSGADPKVLVDSFNSISRQLYEKDAPKAREWIQNNRYSLSAEQAKQLTYNLMNNSYYRDRQKTLDTIEWSLKQKLLLPTDRETRQIVQRMGVYEPVKLRTVLQNLDSQMGIETEGLTNLLPKPRKQKGSL